MRPYDATTSVTGDVNTAGLDNDGAELDEAVQAMRLRLARAASRNARAMLINRDNMQDRWVSLVDAVASRQAFSVEVDHEILALDCDRREKASEARHLAGTYRQLELRPLLIASGSPGRLHVFVRVADPDLRGRLARDARRVGMDVRHAIRPPLAPHRLGYVPALLEPRDPEEAWRALTPARRLSTAMGSLLRRGDVEKRYRSRSEVDQALALAAYNAGWTFERYVAVLRDGRNVAGEKLRDRAASSRNAAERYARRTWQRARDRAVTHPAIANRSGAERAIAEIRAAADGCRWPGQGGSTDYAVLTAAHLAVASRRGCTRYGLSVRQAAELAGVAARTAHKSHRRLVENGWLLCVERSRGPTATWWRVRVPPGQLDNSPTSVGGV